MYFNINNHSPTLTLKISSFCIFTEEMSIIFEKFSQFWLRHEDKKIKIKIRNFDQNFDQFVHQNPATAESRERIKVYIARLGT